MTFDCLEKKVDRIVIQGCDLLLDDFRKNTGFRGIEADVSIQYSLFQCSVEDAVDVFTDLGHSGHLSRHCPLQGCCRSFEWCAVLVDQAVWHPTLA